MKISEEYPKFVEVGKQYRYPQRNFISEKIHVLAEVEDHIVYKRWSPSKQVWRYMIESRWWLDCDALEGRITEYRRKRK